MLGSTPETTQGVVVQASSNAGGKALLLFIRCCILSDTGCCPAPPPQKVARHPFAKMVLPNARRKTDWPLLMNFRWRRKILLGNGKALNWAQYSWSDTVLAGKIITKGARLHPRQTHRPPQGFNPQPATSTQVIGRPSAFHFGDMHFMCHGMADLRRSFTRPVRMARFRLHSDTHAVG